jgi:hypothetical protein
VWKKDVYRQFLVEEFDFQYNFTQDYYALETPWNNLRDDAGDN